MITFMYFCVFKYYSEDQMSTPVAVMLVTLKDHLGKVMKLQSHEGLSNLLCTFGFGQENKNLKNRCQLQPIASLRCSPLTGTHFNLGCPQMTTQQTHFIAKHHRKPNDACMLSNMSDLIWQLGPEVQTTGKRTFSKNNKIQAHKGPSVEVKSQ